MVDKYKAKVDDSGLLAKAAAVDLQPYELLIVASLVEEETQQADERAKVARVIYNRLEQDFYLGIDAAILYGLGRSCGGLSAGRPGEGDAVQQPAGQGPAADADRQPRGGVGAGRGEAGAGAVALLRADDDKAGGTSSPTTGTCSTRPRRSARPPVSAESRRPRVDRPERPSPSVFRVRFVWWSRGVVGLADPPGGGRAGSLCRW